MNKCCDTLIRTPRWGECMKFECGCCGSTIWVYITTCEGMKAESLKLDESINQYYEAIS